MITKDIVIDVKNEGDASPAAVLVQLASRYDSSIYINQENKKVNAKSIMGMMALGVINGNTVTVTADGADEENAIESIETYLSGVEQ